MNSKRDNLLWKLEHDATKCEVFVEDYLMYPKLSFLRGSVKIATRHFSGVYAINLHYDDVINFTRKCNYIYAQMDSGVISEDVAVYGLASRSSLQVEAKCDSENRVMWGLRCMPAAFGTEVLSITFPSSYQLLRSIETGVDRIWQRWPGGKSNEPPLNNG